MHCPVGAEGVGELKGLQFMLMLIRSIIKGLCQYDNASRYGEKILVCLEIRATDVCVLHGMIAHVRNFAGVVDSG